MIPQDIWLATLSQLQLQLPRSTYDTWLRDSKFVAYDEATHTYTIQVRNTYAKDWLEQKLYRAIQQGLSKTAQDEAVQFCFVARRVEVREAAAVEDSPEVDSVAYWRQRALEAEHRVEQLEHQIETETDHARRWPTPLQAVNASRRQVLIDQDELQAALPMIRENNQALALLATLALADQQTGQFETTAGDVGRMLGYGEKRRQWSDFMKDLDNGKVAVGEQIGHTRRVTLKQIFVPILVTAQPAAMENVTDFGTNLARALPSMGAAPSQNLGQLENAVPEFGTKPVEGVENVTNFGTNRPPIYLHTTQHNPPVSTVSTYGKGAAPTEPVRWLLDYLAKETGFNPKRWADFPLFRKATLTIEEIADVVATALWAKWKEPNTPGRVMGWALEDLEQVPERVGFRQAAYDAIGTNWYLVKAGAMCGVAV